jgi:hypothetical protein
MSLVKIKMQSSDVFAFEAIGEICKEDYTKVLFPILDSAIKKRRKIRLLIHFGKKFKSYTKEAIWEDFKFGFKFLGVIDRCAIITDLKWIVNLTSIVGSLIPSSVEVFSNKELDSAKAWIESGDLALDYTLDEDKGVLEVEIAAPLSSLNFEVMTDAVDEYIDKKGALNGLIIHTESFPGWEDFGSFISHVVFIKSHHKKIKKVAFVSDSKITNAIPTLAHHFVNADIKSFTLSEFNAFKSPNKWIMSK